MKKVLFILFHLLSVHGVSQPLHRGTDPKFNDPKDVVYEKLQKYLGAIQFHGGISDMDSFLQLRISINTQEELMVTYFFNHDQKLKAYKYSGCDTCVKGYLNHILNNKKYKWRKLDDSTYYSGFNKHLMIEIQNSSSSLSFTVKQIQIPKRLYNDMFRYRD